MPDDWTVAPGQRVRAPLRGAARTGLVLGVRDGSANGLKSLAGVVDAGPVVTRAQLGLVAWTARQSLSSPGSTAAALLPPPPVPAASAVEPPTSHQPAPEPSKPELHLGPGRERRVLELTTGPLLVLVADVDAAARWAHRLAQRDHVVRLDSGVADAERTRGWLDLGAGRVRFAVGTRSAWIAPLPAGAGLALIDEQEPAHKPPGHPRLHARDVVLERGRRERVRVGFTAGAPSVEMWWRATSGHAVLVSGEPAGWPAVTVADTRGILRREPLTPELARAVRETLASGGRTFLAVSRLTSALACDECGLIIRCPACALAFAYARASARLACRLCGQVAELPDTCPECRGRRLSPFGWGAERVEHAVRRRFPRARIVRYEPDASPARTPTDRALVADADIVIGTRGALRLFGPSTLTLAGFVSPDQLLRLPDFRAGERMLAFVWAAAERLRPTGRLVVQSQNPGHHAFAAVAAHDLARFYGPELAFRAELGYPPFRRLAAITARTDTEGSAAVEALTRALGGSPRVVVYPPTPVRAQRAQRVVVKGHDDLPDALAAALGGGNAVGRGIIEVEVDPVEWPS